MSKKGGRPKQEPTGVRGVRFPVRIWKLVKEASINFRSINEYLRYLIEEDFKNINYIDLYKDNFSNSYVYFMRVGNRVKIGFTNNVVQRRNALQSYCNGTLKGLYFYKGGTVEEKRLHEKFKKYKLGEEWFLYNQDIQDFIDNKRIKE